MPAGSMQKYFADRGGPSHGGDLLWPGTDEGFPVRAPSGMDLKQSEYEGLQHVFDFKSQMFRLWIAEEKKAFDDVNDRILNGWYLQRKRFDYWSSDPLGLVVWLEWAQIYGEIPHGKHPGESLDLPDSVLFRPRTASAGQASGRSPANAG